MEEKRAGAERGGSLGQSGRGRTVLPVRKRIHCGTCRFCFCFFARIFFTRTAHAAEQLFSPAAKRSSAPKEDSGQLSQDGRGAGRAGGGACGGRCGGGGRHSQVLCEGILLSPGRFVVPAAQPVSEERREAESSVMLHSFSLRSGCKCSCGVKRRAFATWFATGSSPVD